MHVATMQTWYSALQQVVCPLRSRIGSLAAQARGYGHALSGTLLSRSLPCRGGMQGCTYAHAWFHHACPCTRQLPPLEP